MEFEIYCDESRQDLFKSPVPRNNFVLIGGIWIKAEDRRAFKQALKEIRDKYNVHSEFKWNKVSPSKIDFYVDLINFYFDNEIRFRTIVLHASELDTVKFHEADKELMFYKFYYQMLHHWILDKNRYRIFVDTKTNRVHSRLNTLKKCLAKSNLLSEIDVQALPSDEMDLMQLADLLIGSVSYKFHQGSESYAKLMIVAKIEERLAHEIRPTPRHEQKFNVFRFKPGGGW